MSTMIWFTVTVSPGFTRQVTMSASVSPSPTSGSRNSRRCVAPDWVVTDSVITNPLSDIEGAVHGVQHPVQVGQVVVLQPRRRVRGGEAAYPQDRRFQLVEALLGDPGRDLRAQAAGDRRLVGPYPPAGAPHRPADGLRVQRGQ